MILGVGIDVIEHSRIKNMELACEFEKKHFTTHEQNLFKNRKNFKYKVIANNFAVKEAFSKALGTGVRGFALNDIEVLRDNCGKPYINLYGRAKRIFDDFGGKTMFVSISDTENISTAVVVIEG